MNILLAFLDSMDPWGVIGVLVVIVLFNLVRGAFDGRRPGGSTRYLERRMKVLEEKLDALLDFHGIEVPMPPTSGLSPEVERLASDPETKIAAIQLYREQNRGIGLAQAKAKIEAFLG